MSVDIFLNWGTLDELKTFEGSSYELCRHVFNGWLWIFSFANGKLNVGLEAYFCHVLCLYLTIQLQFWENYFLETNTQMWEVNSNFEKSKLWDINLKTARQNWEVWGLLCGKNRKIEFWEKFRILRYIGILRGKKSEWWEKKSEVWERNF